MPEYLLQDDLYGPTAADLAKHLAEMQEDGWFFVTAFTWQTDRGFEHTRYIFRKDKPEGAVMIDYRMSPENLKWDFMVVCRFKDNLRPGQRAGALATVTVHVGEVSKEIEVEAAHACGYTVEVYDLRGLTRGERRRLKEEHAHG